MSLSHDPDQSADLTDGATAAGTDPRPEASTADGPDFSRQRAMARSILRTVGLTSRPSRR